MTPYDTVSNYNFANDSIDFYITEYSGNLENYYTREDTVRKVFNTEGYYQDSAYSEKCKPQSFTSKGKIA